MDSIANNKLISNYMTDIKKIDVVQDLHLMVWPFCLSTELWEKYESHDHMVDLCGFKKAKYFDNMTSELSDELKEIPEDRGGIYIYVIENSILPSCGKYIMYVGRAQKGEKHSLAKRVRSHYSQYKRHEENERLERLFDNWKKYIYLLYLPIDNDKIVNQVEKELILSLTPPCNKDYPSPKIRRKLSQIFYV